MRIFHGGLSATLSRGFGVLLSFLSLPLTVRYLGPERYGIWVTISTTTAMLSFMDLGIANSLTNRISEAYAADDRKAAQRYYANSVWATVIICAILGGFAWLVWWHIPWGKLFHLESASATHEASLCVAVGFVFFLLNLPLSLINKVLSGYQQTQITNYVSLLSSLLGLFAILTVIRIRGSLLMLTLLYSAALLVGTFLLNLWVNFWDRRWLVPDPRLFSRSSAKVLLNSGLGFLLLQIAGLVAFNSDNIVITHYLGAAEVTPYSVTWRVTGYAAALQSVVFPSLWPAYAEAYARGDVAWVRRTFWRTIRFGMSSAAAALLILGVFGRSLIRLYVSPSAVPSERLLLAVCLWTLLGTGMNLEACLLAAIDRIKLQGILSVVCAAVNIAMSMYLVKRIGSTGVVLGTIFSYLLVLVGPQTCVVWRALYGSPSGPDVVAVGKCLDSTLAKKTSLLARSGILPFVEECAAFGFRLLVDAVATVGLLPQSKRSTGDTPQRFLVVALGGYLGDSVMILPMLATLRQAYPAARIECVAESTAAILLDEVDSLDRVYAHSGSSQVSDLTRVWQLSLFYWRNMRHCCPDVCIVPRWGDDPFRSRILAYLTKAPKRIGFAANSLSSRTNVALGNRFLSHVVPGAENMHEPVKSVYLLQQSGLISSFSAEQISAWISPSLSAIATRTDWHSLAERLQMDPFKQFAIVAPGASHPRRRWPTERWASLIDHLNNRGLHVVVLAGQQDAEVAQRLQDRLHHSITLVAGATTIIESIALISHAKLFVGNDSGPGHMAGALGIPTVVLFATTYGTTPNSTGAPERVRPVGPYLSICCPPEALSPCVDQCLAVEAHCIAAITPDNVIAAANDAIARLDARAHLSGAEEAFDLP